jgi:hypothetical protein
MSGIRKTNLLIFRTWVADKYVMGFQVDRGFVVENCPDALGV